MFQVIKYILTLYFVYYAVAALNVFTFLLKQYILLFALELNLTDS